MKKGLKIYLQPIIYFFAGSAVQIKALAQKVCRLKQLVRINKGSYQNKTAQHAPKPIASRRKGIGNAPSPKLVAYS